MSLKEFDAESEAWSAKWAADWAAIKDQKTMSSTTTVEKLAAKVGATLASGALAPNGEPLFGAAQRIADYCKPVLDDFRKTTVEFPLRPNVDIPKLPEGINADPRYELLTEIIPRLLAVCESPKSAPKELCKTVMKMIWLLHRETGQAIVRRAQISGMKITENQIATGANGLRREIENATVKRDNFLTDMRGEVDIRNSDNLKTFYDFIGLEIRYNAWLERIEVRGWEFKAGWTFFDDTVEANLRTHAMSSAYRYNLGKDNHLTFATRSAGKNTYDPAVSYLSECEKEWDGVRGS